MLYAAIGLSEASEENKDIKQPLFQKRKRLYLFQLSHTLQAPQLSCSKYVAALMRHIFNCVSLPRRSDTNLREALGNN